MSSTTVSVVIPTWNNAKTLKATILSCLNQTLPPTEILVCDDGSTDDSRALIETIGDNRVIWVPGERSGGPATPRNRGIKLSQGEYIAFCDSDDQWFPTKLEKQVSLIKKTGHRASCTNAVMKRDGHITEITILNWSKKTISFANLLKTNGIVCSSALIHSSVFKEVGGFPEEPEYRSFEDYICWLKISTKTKFAYVNEVLVVYDDHPATSIRKNSPSDAFIKKLSYGYFLTWLNSSNTSPLLKLWYSYGALAYNVKTKIVTCLKK